MLDSREFAERLRACADGSASIEDFEEWFDSKSWNIHQQNDSELSSAVGRVEALYSAYYDHRLDECMVRSELAELANTIDPFAVVHELVYSDAQVARKEPAHEAKLSARPHRFQTAYAAL
jgi:hypothetical protein